MAELMKGHTWAKGKHKMTYPCIVEEKVDEIRCHVKITVAAPNAPIVEFISYAGKPLNNMGQFADHFLALSHTTGHKEFDCGFEVNGKFNDSYRWVRSKSIPEDLNGVWTQFYLFDLPESTKPYDERHRELFKVCLSAPLLMHIHPADFWMAYSEHDVNNAYDMIRSTGGEGAMVKSLDHTYQRGKRIYGWLKLKPEEEADGEIIELIEARATVDNPELGVRAGDPLGRIGSIRVRVEDGSEATPHGIAHDLGKEMFLNPQAYIGEWVEFRFMERDRQGGYRHPTFNRFREAKV